MRGAEVCTFTQDGGGEIRQIAIALFLTSILGMPTPASAETFIDIARKNPLGTYLQIKRSFAAEDKIEKDRLKQLGLPDDPLIEVYGLDVCEGAAVQRRFDDLDVKLLHRLADHAHEVLNMRSVLTGYPASVWRDDLVAYEKAQFARIASGKQPSSSANVAIRSSLAQKAAVYRQQNPGTVNTVKARAQECGEGEGKYKVKIVTEPRAFRIQYVSMRVFNYCEEAVSDPQLREKCWMWTNMGGSAHRMIGTYKVRVFWTEDKSELFNVPLDEVDESGAKETKDGIVYYRIKGKVPG